jgi:hypothetical protein
MSLGTAGSFMGELAQLSGRPSLVDAYAKEAVQALLIPPRRLRDLLVEESELGERIMRALILRRVALLGFGAGGPVIVGSAIMPMFCASKVSSPATGIRTSDWTQRPIRVHKR